MGKVLQPARFLHSGKFHCARCGKGFDKDEEAGADGENYYCIPCVAWMGATIYQYPQQEFSGRGFVPAN